MSSLSQVRNLTDEPIDGETELLKGGIFMYKIQIKTKDGSPYCIHRDSNNNAVETYNDIKSVIHEVFIQLCNECEEIRIIKIK